MLSSLFAFVTLSLLAVAAPVAEERTANACTDVIVVLLGTKYLFFTAPIGTIVGPPLQTALQAALSGKSLTFTGVDYPADIAGFLEGRDLAGSATMAQDAAIVTSGYSQGGQLVHNLAKLLSASVLSRINAAVIFGNPNDGEAVQGVSAANADVICHVGDDICLHGDLILAPHL
ncbi:cutinase [Mycena olivaceomarginata]|nr:cutinase [Mycena olivaceomarginata]